MNLRETEEKYLELLDLSNPKIKDLYTDTPSNNNEEQFKVVVKKDQEIINKDKGIMNDSDTWDIYGKLSREAIKIKNKNKTDEDKILDIYNYICLNYTYDDNANYYIQKVEDGVYKVGEWYGKKVSEEWKKNRRTHNKRVCFELSRLLAGSLEQILPEATVCILYDEKNVHYFVGVNYKDYKLSLDPDNFNLIKDITRLKLGLTENGIVVLEDKTNKFKKSLDKFNENRPEHLQEIEKLEEEDIDDATFIQESIELVKEKGLDPHGFYEIMKKIVRNRNISTKNIYKLINNKRYERCLLFLMKDKYKNKMDENDFWIIDSVDQDLLKVNDLSELDKSIYITKRGLGPVNEYDGGSDDLEPKKKAL